MGWDTNWVASEGRGKLPRGAFNQLNQALNSRNLKTNTPGYVSGIPEIIVGGLDPFHPVFSVGNWMDKFDNLLFGWPAPYLPEYTTYPVIEKYGNHQSLTPKMWTEDDLLLALGDAEWVTAPKSKAGVAEWAWQRYRVLNLLRVPWSKAFAFPSFGINSVIAYPRYYFRDVEPIPGSTDGKFYIFAGKLCAINKTSGGNYNVSSASEGTVPVNNDSTDPKIAVSGTANIDHWQILPGFTPTGFATVAEADAYAYNRYIEVQPYGGSSNYTEYLWYATYGPYPNRSYFQGRASFFVVKKPFTVFNFDYRDW